MGTRWIPLLILLVFAAAGCLYSWANPPFEAPDERSHFLYIHNLLVTGELPYLEADRAAVFASGSVQRHHPPLYYLVGALLISGTQRQDFAAYNLVNPLGASGTIQLNNLNIMLHPPATGGDTGSAITMLRLYSLVLGMGTLLLVYRTAQLAFDSATIGALAMALVGSMPMFVYLHASISNDPLVTFFYSAGVCWLVWVWRKRHLTLRDALILGLILAGIALSKVNGLTLFGVVGVVLLVGALQRRWTWGKVLQTGLIAGICVVLLAGWWYFRNVQLYGDPLALDATRRIWGRGELPPDWVLWGEMRGVWESLWLIFGHFTIRTHDLFYGYVTVFSVIGGLGATVYGLRHKTTRGMLLLAVFVVVSVVAGLLIATRSVNASQGRILFPMLTGFAALLMAGWWQFLRRWALIPLLPLVAMTLYAPIGIVLPSYPYPLPVTEIPASATRVNARAETLELVAYEIQPDTMNPDDSFRVSVYIQGNHAANPLLYFKIIDPYSLVPVGGVDFYAGMRLTSQLDPMVLYRVDTRLKIDRVQLTGITPRQLDVVFGWRVPSASGLSENDPTLTWTLPDGSTPSWLRLPALTLIDPDYQLPTPQYPTQVQFGGAVDWVGYDLSATTLKAGATLEVRLFWRTQTALPADWNALVGLVNAEHQLVTQTDGGIRGYPSRAWRANVPAEDQRTLTIPADMPAGTYQLVVGWYDPQHPDQRLTAAGSGNLDANLFFSEPLITISE